MEIMGFKHIDILKLDIEGAEFIFDATGPICEFDDYRVSRFN